MIWLRGVRYVETDNGRGKKHSSDGGVEKLPNLFIHLRKMSFFRDIYPRLCMKILLSYRSQFSRPRLSRIGTSTGPYSAAHALTRNSKVETEDDVGEMLRSLRSRSIAWARPGSAQFDFRSTLSFPFEA